MRTDLLKLSDRIVIRPDTITRIKFNERGDVATVFFGSGLDQEIVNDPAELAVLRGWMGGAGAEKGVAELQVELGKVTEDRDSLYGDRAGLRTQVDNLRRDKERLQSELDTAVAQLHEAAKRRDQLDERLDRERAESRRLLSEARTACAEVERKLCLRTRELGQANVEADQAKAEVERLKAETPKTEPSPAPLMVEKDGFSWPRRSSVEHWTPAERAIWDAVGAVEEAGCHPLLTDAVTLLGQAKDKVAEFVDGELRKEAPTS